MSWDWLLGSDEVVASHLEPARPGSVGEWPQWLPQDCVESFQAAGIEAPWLHQVEFAELARARRHAAISTPTASGKSLAYLMPIITATTAEPAAAVGTNEGRFVARPPTALYLAPTKALAHDQYRAAKRLGPDGWRIGTLDGDSDQAERSFACEHASLVLTNPDMLHFSMLPGHQRWSRFLGGLQYVVVDEAHRYQGVFGSHVAAVLRRLRRLCHLHGAEPTLLLCSATAPNAARFAGELIGEDQVAVVGTSAAPKPERTTVLWQPSTSLNQDTAALLSGLSDDGRQTLAFVASRAGAELVSLAAQERASHPERIASYRAGYLALDRRQIEAALRSSQLTGLATTNALELGVDLAGAEAVLVAGFPGRLAAFRQQAGRAGRSGQSSVVVLLARENPLDAYLLTHPHLVFEAAVEELVLHAQNPHVLGPHLAAAAQEHPLEDGDERWFGDLTTPLADHLAGQGVLRKRGARWFWTRPQRAVDFINLRSGGPSPVDIVDKATGRILGVVDHGAADRTVHPGAVYIHQGETWLVEEFDEPENLALVSNATPSYYTQAQSVHDIRVLRELRNEPLGRTVAAFGDVVVSSQVLGYLRRDEVTHEVWDQTPLDMPERELRTQAVWWTVPREVELELDWPALRMGAAVHAAEHTAIGLLPLFAPCDRWDIGGVSTAIHPDTGLATIFVHDSTTGGAGFSARGFERLAEWLRATLDRLQTCPCDVGCPACIISPKCGNANAVLDKADATRLLELLLT